MRSVVVVLPASTWAMTPMLRRLRRGVVFEVMMILSGDAVGCSRRLEDHQDGQPSCRVPWPEHGRGEATSRRSGIVAISLSYVRMACLAGGERTNPGRLAP